MLDDQDSSRRDSLCDLVNQRVALTNLRRRGTSLPVRSIVDQRERPLKKLSEMYSHVSRPLTIAEARATTPSARSFPSARDRSDGPSPMVAAIHNMHPLTRIAGHMSFGPR